MNSQLMIILRDNDKVLYKRRLPNVFTCKKSLKFKRCQSRMENVSIFAPCFCTNLHFLSLTFVQSKDTLLIPSTKLHATLVYSRTRTKDISHYEKPLNRSALPLNYDFCSRKLYWKVTQLCRCGLSFRKCYPLTTFRGLETTIMVTSSHCRSSMIYSLIPEKILRTSVYHPLLGVRSKFTTNKLICRTTMQCSKPKAIT